MEKLNTLKSARPTGDASGATQIDCGSLRLGIGIWQFRSAYQTRLEL